MGSSSYTAIKICGLTVADQAAEVAAMGVEAVGIVGAKNSPRYVGDAQRRLMFSTLKATAPLVKRVWVVANPEQSEIASALKGEGLPSTIQLHGHESPEYCAQLRREYPKIEWWKALRIRKETDLNQIQGFKSHVDSLLIDTWSPQQLGGTGHRLPLEWVKNLSIDRPWWLAGGISANCIQEVISEVNPPGLDASSRLESSPGIKDLKKVKDLIKAIRH